MINTVIHGDCRKIDIPQVDLILTDPPYGIGYKNEKLQRKSNSRFDEIQNDEKEIDFKFLFDRPELKIIFGANNFYKQLPHKGIWLCWDKRVNEAADSVLGSAFELAWCSKTNGYYKIYRVQHGGVVNHDMKYGEARQRWHPTQKPIELMKRIILDFTKENDIILDPFCGSGSALVAAQQLNRRFIGIEIDKKYYEISKTRLRPQTLL